MKPTNVEFLWDDYDKIYFLTDTHATEYPKLYKKLCIVTKEKLLELRGATIVHLGDRESSEWFDWDEFKKELDESNRIVEVKGNHDTTGFRFVNHHNGKLVFTHFMRASQCKGGQLYIMGHLHPKYTHADYENHIIYLEPNKLFWLPDLLLDYKWKVFAVASSFDYRVVMAEEFEV
jgi:Icc-related predicted phosphoesterase